MAGAGRPGPAARQPAASGRPRRPLAAGRSPAGPTRMSCRGSCRLGPWAQWPWPARRAWQARRARQLVPARQASCARLPLQARPACESRLPSQLREAWLLRLAPASATAPASLRAAPLQDRRAVPRPPCRPAVASQPSRWPQKARDLPVHEAKQVQQAQQALPARQRASPAPGVDRPLRAFLQSPALRAARTATLPSRSPARPPDVTRWKLQGRAATGLASSSGRDTRARRHRATPRARAATRRWTHRHPAAPGSPARAELSCPREARVPEASRPWPSPVQDAQGGRQAAPSRRLRRRPAATACGRSAGSTGRCCG